MKIFNFLLLLFCAFAVRPFKAVELSSIHKKFTSENLPLILAESLAVLEKYYDISSCVPFSVTQDQCLATRKCPLPPLKISPLISLNLRGSAKLCLNSLVVSPTLSINNADVKIQPFRIHIKTTGDFVEFSFKIQAEVAGKNFYKLFIGNHKVSAVVKIGLRLDEIKKDKLHYKFNVKYSIRKKDLISNIFVCSHCHKDFNKEGMLDASPFLSDIL